MPHAPAGCDDRPVRSSRGFFVKRLLLAAALSAQLALASSAAFAGPVDDRFQAIYDKEWQWRQA